MIDKKDKLIVSYVMLIFNTFRGVVHFIFAFVIPVKIIDDIPSSGLKMCCNETRLIKNISFKYKDIYVI